jgi:hypothetical protein
MHYIALEIVLVSVKEDANFKVMYNVNDWVGKVPVKNQTLSQSL